MINFPASPVVGDLYPVPPQAGVPQYKWDGTVWTAQIEQPLTYVKRTGDTMTGILALSGDPVAALDAVPKRWAAPMDAMAYSGMQINGSMEVSQERGADVLVGAGAGYVLDGWAVYKTGTSTINAGQFPAVTPSGIPKYLGVQVTTAQASMGATDYVQIQQSIEGYRIARLAWGTVNAKPLTIGFWSGHVRTGTYSVSVVNTNWGSRHYTATYTQNASGVFEYKTITIPGETTGSWDTGNLAGISISFMMACGTDYIAPAANAWYSTQYLAAPGQVNGVAATSDIFAITGVTVLPGIHAPSAAQSPLIMRPYDQELVLCQRYFQWVPIGMSFFADGANYQMNTTVTFMTEMRAIPTMSITLDPALAPGTNINVAGGLVGWTSITPRSATAYMQGSGAGSVYFDGYRSPTDARL